MFKMNQVFTEIEQQQEQGQGSQFNIPNQTVSEDQ